MELGLVGDRFEVAEGNASLGEVFLLRVLVLDDGQCATRGLYVDAHVLELLERLRVDVLDLHGDHVAVLGEGDDVVAVLIGTQGVLGRDGGWGGIGRVEAVELDAHRRRGDGEHAAELAAAQDANLGVPGQPIVAHRVGVVVRLAAEEPRAHADGGTAGGAGGSAAAPGARHGDRRNVGGAHRCEHRDDGFWIGRPPTGGRESGVKKRLSLVSAGPTPWKRSGARERSSLGRSARVCGLV